ncbi:MAG TPA: GAF domain-containing protein, partial [Tepidisphaeraceae bacterium]|nr:GAF domain-containing protein [Tepidisphaeraceae bacterium]
MQYVTATPTDAGNQAATVAAASPIPTAVLDNLAARFRPGGLYLLCVLPDGTLFYHDPQAGLFFHRFVLPLVQYSDASAPPAGKQSNFRDRLAQLGASSPMAAWDCLPGVMLAAFPYAERRQLSAVILLAAKSASFKLGEEVVRVCSRLGLDGIWLGQQADELPTYCADAIVRQGRLLSGMLADQVRLGSLETELNSLSSQLANTYEELSLVYQISGGMRITRGAGDFFKQACLDVLEVMSVEGIGVAVSAKSGQRQDPVLYGRLSFPPGTVKQLADDLLPILGRRKSALLINDLPHDKTFGWLGAHARQLLAVPMLRGEEVLGCFFACDKASGEFDSQDSKLLSSIANESAIYLENAMLFDDAHGLMMGLLHSLTSAVDAKDAYTCGHSERVALLARQLTMEAGIGEAFAERAYM